MKLLMSWLKLFGIEKYVKRGFSKKCLNENTSIYAELRSGLKIRQYIVINYLKFGRE